jgi:hypothetical protein
MGDPCPKKCVAHALRGWEATYNYQRLSLAKTSSRSQVVDLSAPSGHNRGS